MQNEHKLCAAKRRRLPGRATTVVAGAVAAVVVAGTVWGNTPSPAMAAPRVTGDTRVDKLLSRMTLDEKLTMVAGSIDTAADPQYQAGYLPGIPRLGIPSLHLADGPPGVVTKQDSTGMTATMGVAATFSRSDAKQNGVVIGRDDRDLGQDVSLQPFVNLDRDTTGGRGFNTFGEDPYLTGQMGAAETTGIQSQGTMAMVKHYIAYDGPNNANVDEQTLHEIYLQPFADAIDAGAASVMCSYNVVNSEQACGNSDTLTSILRNELGFKGFVASDWGANHGTTYINAGLDMEMPGQGWGNDVPGRPLPGGAGFPAYFGKAQLKAAIHNGSVSKTRLTEAVGRILFEYDRFGLLGRGPLKVKKENRTADNRVVQATSEHAATLLQNDDQTLPLKGKGSLALIGPGAGQTIATDGGGEKSPGIASEQVGTYQVLRQTVGVKRSLTYAVGDDMTGTPVPASALSSNGKAGLKRTGSNGSTSVDEQIDFTAADNTALPAGSSNTWDGTLAVPSAGDYWLNIQALGSYAVLTVDGKIAGNAGGGFDGQGGGPRYGVVHPGDGNGPLPTTDGLANARTKLTLTAGQHAIQVKEVADVSHRPVQVRLNWVTPQQQQSASDAAVAAAKKADTAVVFAWGGASDDLSRPLPEDQDKLINRIAKVNPNVVVVLNTSQPVAMPWLSKVKSVVEMWYSGDRGGYATANVLLGKASPDGKLPFTWPKSVDQEVAHQADHPERTSAGVNGVTTYSEGVNVGYRYFLATGEKPLYPFGYGLSYTSFKYSGLTVNRAADAGLDVRLRVHNTGSVDGAAVPQVYLGAPKTQPAGAQFAPRTLAGFDRVTLAAGQSKTVTIHVPKRQLQYWATGNGWTTAAGSRTVYLATSAQDDIAQQGVTIPSS